MIRASVGIGAWGVALSELEADLHLPGVLREGALLDEIAHRLLVAALDELLLAMLGEAAPAIVFAEGRLVGGVGLRGRDLAALTRRQRPVEALVVNANLRRAPPLHVATTGNRREVVTFQ